MKFFGKFGLPVAILLWLGCQNEAPPVTRVDKIANGFCECTAQLAALNKQVAGLAADTVAGRDLRPFFQQMQLEYGKAKECSAAIIAQFGKLKEEEFAQVERALQNKCPDLTEQRDLLREMLGE